MAAPVLARARGPREGQFSAPIRARELDSESGVLDSLADLEVEKCKKDLFRVQPWAGIRAGRPGTPWFWGIRGGGPVWQCFLFGRMFFFGLARSQLGPGSGCQTRNQVRVP